MKPTEEDLRVATKVTPQFQYEPDGRYAKRVRRVASALAEKGSEITELRELASAALLALSRIRTEKLASLGRDQDAVAVSDARRLLDIATRSRR